MKLFFFVIMAPFKTVAIYITLVVVWVRMRRCGV